MIFSLFWEGAFIRRGAFIRGGVYYKSIDFRGAFIRGGVYSRRGVYSRKYGIPHSHQTLSCLESSISYLLLHTAKYYD